MRNKAHCSLSWQSNLPYCRSPSESSLVCHPYSETSGPQCIKEAERWEKAKKEYIIVSCRREESSRYSLSYGARAFLSSVIVNYCYSRKPNQQSGTPASHFLSAEVLYNEDLHKQTLHKLNMASLRLKFMLFNVKGNKRFIFLISSKASLLVG